MSVAIDTVPMTPRSGITVFPKSMADSSKVLPNALIIFELILTYYGLIWDIVSIQLVYTATVVIILSWSI